MAEIEARLESLGLVLPRPLILPPGAVLPFPWVRVRGARRGQTTCRQATETTGLRQLQALDCPGSRQHSVTASPNIPRNRMPAIR